MAKVKLQNSVWNILFEGLKLYFKNIGTFSKYMLFPVFGQIIGIVLIFSLTGWFTFNLPTIVAKHPAFNDFSVILLTLLLITIPGFAVFLKAFWDYLVAYGALNSMAQAVLSTGKLYDLKAHNEVITKRTFAFVGLLLAITILTLIAINPLFWVIGLVFFIYFILVFQVFTFEEDKSIIECFKRSLALIKGNFARTFFIATVLGVISYYILSYCVTAFVEVIRLGEILKGIFEAWAQTLPLADINATAATFKLPAITPLDVAEQVFNSSIFFIVAGLTLPMRSVCWTLWYKNLAEIKTQKLPKKGK